MLLHAHVGRISDHSGGTWKKFGLNLCPLGPFWDPLTPILDKFGLNVGLFGSMLRGLEIVTFSVKVL